MSNLEQAIIKDEEALTKLYKQRDKVNEKIKNLEVKVEKNKMIKNNQNYNALLTKISEKGISIDDLLKVLQDGDLLSLQEKLESDNTEN